MTARPDVRPENIGTSYCLKCHRVLQVVDSPHIPDRIVTYCDHCWKRRVFCYWDDDITWVVPDPPPPPAPEKGE